MRVSYYVSYDCVGSFLSTGELDSQVCLFVCVLQSQHSKQQQPCMCMCGCAYHNSPYIAKECHESQG